MRAAGGGEGEADNGGFPWAEICRFGLARLRLDPAHFWKLTPREIALMAASSMSTRELPTREGLGALMQRFPDHETMKDEQNGWP